MMELSISLVGSREFLNLGDCCSIPVDSITGFDFDVANGGASGESVQIKTTDGEEYIFAYENRDAIREFLDRNLTT